MPIPSSSSLPIPVAKITTQQENLHNVSPQNTQLNTAKPPAMRKNEQAASLENTKASRGSLLPVPVRNTAQFLKGLAHKKSKAKAQEGGGPSTARSGTSRRPTLRGAVSFQQEYGSSNNSDIDVSAIDSTQHTKRTLWIENQMQIINGDPSLLFVYEFILGMIDNLLMRPEVPTSPIAKPDVTTEMAAGAREKDQKPNSLSADQVLWGGIQFSIDHTFSVIGGDLSLALSIQAA